MFDIMKPITSFYSLLIVAFSVLAFAGEQNIPATKNQIRLYSVKQKGFIMADKVIKSDQEWKKELTPSSLM